MKRGFNNIFLFSSSKKGLSDVVATLVVILLVLVAVGVVWAAVQGLIRGGAEQVELNSRCNEVDFQSVGISESGGGNYTVTLDRTSSGETINGVKVAFFNSSGASSGVLEFGASLDPLERQIREVDTSLGNLVLNANRFDMTPYFVDESGNEDLCSQTRSFSLGSLGTTPIGGGEGEGEGEGGEGGGEEEGGEGAACTSDMNCSSGFRCDIGLGQCVALCSGTWNQTYYNETIYECDADTGGVGCNTGTCLCNAGFGPDALGGCDLDSPIDTGSINSVWNNIYLDSYNLPLSTNVSTYISYYMNFTNSSEVGCFRIDYAQYLPDNGISYVRLDDSLGYPNVAPAQGYIVWEAANCGN